jgi:hypothetical protein
MISCTFCGAREKEKPSWICNTCHYKGKRRGRKYCVFCNIKEELVRVGLVWVCHGCIAELQAVCSSLQTKRDIKCACCHNLISNDEVYCKACMEEALATKKEEGDKACLS